MVQVRRVERLPGPAQTRPTRASLPTAVTAATAFAFAARGIAFPDSDASAIFISATAYGAGAVIAIFSQPSPCRRWRGRRQGAAATFAFDTPSTAFIAIHSLPPTV